MDPLVRELTRLRVASGLTRPRIERESGVSASAMWEWEVGAAEPGVANFRACLGVFGRRLVVQPLGVEATISNILGVVRTSAKMSMRDLERRSGVSGGSIYYWRKPGRSPRLHNVSAVVESMGCRLEIVGEDNCGDCTD